MGDDGSDDDSHVVEKECRRAIGVASTILDES